MDDCLESAAGLVAEAGRLGFRKEKESLSFGLFEALWNLRRARPSARDYGVSGMSRMMESVAAHCRRPKSRRPGSAFPTTGMAGRGPEPVADAGLLPWRKGQIKSLLWQAGRRAEDTRLEDG